MIIAVKHNIEVSHRLFESPGKCENLHGHSMKVILGLEGPINNHGMMCGLDFGEVKKKFRDHLDTCYDHHTLLNEADPWSKPMVPIDVLENAQAVLVSQRLPGLITTPGDPTTENIACWVAKQMQSFFGETVRYVEVWETEVNMARWERPTKLSGLDAAIELEGTRAN